MFNGQKLHNQHAFFATAKNQQIMRWVRWMSRAIGRRKKNWTHKYIQMWIENEICVTKNGTRGSTV